MLLGFFAFVAWDQMHWWSERDEYSFGYLVPLFVAYVVFDRWPRIRELLRGQGDPERSGDDGAGESPPAEVAPSVTRTVEGAALLGFFGGLIAIAIGATLRSVHGPQQPASLALSTGLATIVLTSVFLLSRETPDGSEIRLGPRLRLMACFLFPALIWLISAPMVSFLETQIRVFLLQQVTAVVFTVFDILAYELERQGNVLIMESGRVGVEEACSGIRSLTACIFAGSFLAAIFLDRGWKKVALVISAMVLAFLTNMMRSLFLTYYAYHNGASALDSHWTLPLIGDIGSVHDVTGYAILGVTCVGLFLLLPVFNYTLPSSDDLDAPDREDSAGATA